MQNPSFDSDQSICQCNWQTFAVEPSCLEIFRSTQVDAESIQCTLRNAKNAQKFGGNEFRNKCRRH
jgi:hypothetical protein